MGRKKNVDIESTPAPEASSNGTPEVKTKAAAFRAAVAQGIVSPTAISEFVKTTYGMEMSAGMVSAYKSMEKNKGRKKAPKATRAPKSDVPSGHQAGNGRNADLMASLESIKMLVKNLGADQVKRMADLFA
jgi:hypothetical protein